MIKYFIGNKERHFVLLSKYWYYGFGDEINIENYFFENPLGNHQVIVPGKFGEIVKEFFKIFI